MDESVHNVWCWEWKGEMARGRKDGSREGGEGTESQTEEMKGKKGGKGKRCGRKVAATFHTSPSPFPSTSPHSFPHCPPPQPPLHSTSRNWYESLPISRNESRPRIIQTALTTRARTPIRLPSYTFPIATPLHLTSEGLVGRLESP